MVTFCGSSPAAAYLGNPQNSQIQNQSKVRSKVPPCANIDQSNSNAMSKCFVSCAMINNKNIINQLVAILTLV